MQKILTGLLLLTTLAFSAAAQSQPDFEEILEKMDFQSTFDEYDFSSEMTMISEDPDDGIEKLVVHQFRRDQEDKFVMLIEEPDVQRGQGYLRIDDNLWFYDPESRKFSHSSMKENFSGTDAKNSDFRKSTLAEDYSVGEWKEGKLGSYDVYIMELKALNNEVTYPTMKVWVTKKNYLLLKSEDYSLTGRLMRTSLFPKYARLGDSMIPVSMIFVDELVDGKKTQVSLKDLSIKDLPNSIFTKAYIERVNR